MTSEPPSARYVGACPAWCIDCQRTGEPDGFVVHQSATYATTVYDEDSGPLLDAVRATHFDQNPRPRQGPPNDLDGPLIDVTVQDNIASLRLTPTQADSSPAS